LEPAPETVQILLPGDAHLLDLPRDEILQLLQQAGPGLG
jgi:hypothetical protein